MKFSKWLGVGPKLIVFLYYLYSGSGNLEWSDCSQKFDIFPTLFGGCPCYRAFFHRRRRVVRFLVQLGAVQPAGAAARGVAPANGNARSDSHFWRLFGSALGTIWLSTQFGSQHNLDFGRIWSADSQLGTVWLTSHSCCKTWDAADIDHDCPGKNILFSNCVQKPGFGSGFHLRHTVLVAGGW